MSSRLQMRIIYLQSVRVEGQTHARYGHMEKAVQVSLGNCISISIYMYIHTQLLPEKVLDALIHGPKDFLARYWGPHGANNGT